MRMRCLAVLLLLCFGAVGTAAAQTQPSSADSGRKVVRKTIPAYPDIAKKMGLTGTVRVLAVVAPDGTVRTVEPVGGSPVLIEASKQAILRWKYAPASTESREEVTLHFDPQGQ